VESPETRPVPTPLERIERVHVVGYTVHRSRGEVEAEVVLGAGELRAEGRSVGPSTRFEHRRVVGQAVLDALAKLVEGDPGLSLGEMEERGLGDRRVLLVCVNRTVERAETAFLGSCEIGYEPEQTVILAILDAVNRLMGTLRPREPIEYRIGPV